ncbi:SGNH/GDSL hydrolase family protein [Hymenobacter sp. B81]|uniref:SGNH/GDSL hydrolase family protein n=1 Tax=Hymenobacter sp. B81 TaxID=3344878 RepID=UPI0037DCCAAA
MRILLSLILLLGSLLPLSGALHAQTTPERARIWAGAMRAFARQDSLAPPPAGGSVFTGSSSIVGWRSLATDFPGRPLLNRGFGGSHFPDVIQHFEQVVKRYRPRQVVLYVGDNDLGAGRTPAQVIESYRTFARRLRRELPGTRLLYLAIKPSPSRWHLQPQMREVNRAIRRYCRFRPGRRFADVAAPMLGPSGKPRPELYQADSLHMTAAGYALWKRVVGPKLVK